MNRQHSPRLWFQLTVAAGLIAVSLPVAPWLLAQEAEVEHVQDNRSVDSGTPAAAPAPAAAETPAIPADAREGDAAGEADRPRVEGEATEQNR